MPFPQNPIGKKDLKVTHNWDLVLKSKNNRKDLTIVGEENKKDLLEQIVRLALKTKKGSFATDSNFGASPQGRKTYMTRESVEGLKSFILQNLYASGINYNNISIKVDAIPITIDTLAIHVAIFVIGSEDNGLITINSIFNESTQEIQTIKAFGV
jgi:hypothetical protein